MSKVLIIDDDEMMCKAMAALIERMGHKTSSSFTLTHGLEKARCEDYDVVLLDVRMPDGNGLDLFPEIRDTRSQPEVIVMTAAGDPEGAELAIKSGAWDYIEKTSSIKNIILPLTRALQYREEKLSRTPPVALKRERIIGNSTKMKACLDLVAQASVSEANVLIIGETGTGKELLARAIHSNRPRDDKGTLARVVQGKKKPSDHNFVVVDCTALPETLIESVLFGHERGAFTGADKTQDGLISQANGGTLFLDEVGELHLGIQKTFLRVLQEHRFRPIGGSAEVESDFRLIAATNRDLDQMAEKGEFRRDLLFRLKALTIELPPLRERKEDIKDLTRFHVAKLCDRYGIETKGFSPEFFSALEFYDWPGNVRELVNTLEVTLSAAGKAPTLFSRYLPDPIRVKLARASMTKQEPPHGHPEDKACSPPRPILKLRDFRQSMEKQYLQELLSQVNHDIGKACELSGLSRSHFYDLLAKYDLSLSQE